MKNNRTNKIKNYLIFISILTLVLGFYFNKYIDKKKRQEQKRENAIKIENKISQLVEQTNAIDDWYAKLNQKRTTYVNPILTVDLENVWLQERPILFLGSIKDIATFDETQYKIKIELDILKYLLLGDISLNLLCQKQNIDPFLKEHREIFDNFGLDNRFAVIAKITEIKNDIINTNSISDMENNIQVEGERKEVKMGYGKCVELVYIGGLLLEELEK